MKNNKDFEFIKNEFEKENITAPNSLDENAVKDKLEGKTQKKIKLYQSKSFKKISAAVACVAVAVTALTVTKPYILNKNNDVPETENPQQVLNYFSDIGDIKAAVKKIEKQEQYFLYSDTVKSASEEVATDTAEGGAGGGGSSYAQTYKQVDAVDEGDIIKNDGEHIYYVNSMDNSVVIYSADGDNTEVASTIDDFKISNSDTYTEESSTAYEEYEYISDIYIYNKKLIVNTSRNVYKSADYSEYEETAVTHIYDITDISNPEEINSFAQSGYYSSSRMIGSQLYVVSNDYIYSEQCKEDEDYIPYVCNGKDAKEESIAVEDICYTENPNSASYLIVSSINVETGKKASDTKALFGAGEDIYCNENNMYVAMNEWSSSWKTFSDDDGQISSTVSIVKINLSESDIKFTAQGEVDGHTLNQFSMDEKDGKLRVATTSYNKDGKEINNLFVLDENLNKIGEVTGFAETESIKAVRFIGDTAYVITYEQIDPLFVIDLSEPTNPQIKGEAEITGFSSLLIPVDENTLLGIGYSTDDSQTENDMEITDGTKLALFDISNPENPQVLDSYVMKNAYSDAQYNHHALVVNPDRNYYAIPYNSYGNSSEGGALVFEIADGKISITDKFICGGSGYSDMSRCTYINDTLYVLDYSADIYSFNAE